MKNVQLVAHRGYSRRYPENTLIALEQAILSGAEFIELDIQLSKDHIPIVIHDNNLKRISNIDKCVFNMLATDLKTSPAGEPRRFANQFSDVKIALLQDVVELLIQYPKTTAFIEIKRASLQYFTTHETVKIILDTLSAIKNQCVIISFSQEALEIARKLGATRIGWIFEPWNQIHEQTARNLSPDYLFTDYQSIPKDPASFWPGPWQWAVYEINDTNTINEYSTLGADLIETDNIGELLSPKK